MRARVHTAMLAGALAIAATACAGLPRGGNSEASRYENSFEAATMVPLSASTAVVADRLAALSGLQLELASLVEVITSRSRGDLDAGFRRRLAVSPMRIEELIDSGLDPSGSVAVFTTPGGVTGVVKVGDRERWDAFIERNRPSKMTLHSIAGHEVSRVKFSGDDEFLSWVVVDDWLLVRYTYREAPWLEPVLAARSGKADKAGKVAQSIAASPYWEKALTAARIHLPKARRGPPADVVGVFHLEKLIREILGPKLLLAALGSPTARGCYTLLKRHLPSAYGAAQVGYNTVDGALTFEISKQAADGLSAARRPAPPAGLFAARADSPMYGSLWIDLDPVETARAESGCSVLPTIPTLRSRLGDGGPTSAHGVAIEIGEQLRGIKLVGHATVAQPSWLDKWLPGGRAGGKAVMIGSVRAREVDMSRSGMRVLRYVAAGEAISFGLGEGALSRALSTQGRVPRGELLALYIEPSAARHTTSLVSTALAKVGLSRLASSLTGWLGRLQHGAIGLHLDGRKLTLTGSLRRAR